jgi:hypothetical protein
MIDLGKLRVSLTKHGAHKVADLLLRFDAQDVLSNLSDSIPGVKIDSVQARKNLSASSTGAVPSVWNQARAAGHESINALVLIAIIFSHGQLIQAMRAARTASMRGTVVRGQVIDEKAFTNFAHTIEQLGYSVSHSADQVSYNLARLFEIPELHRLAADVLSRKLLTAGWDRSNTLVQEMVANGLHEVFGVTAEQFSNWLQTGDVDAVGDTLGDEGFFLGAGEDSGAGGAFIFTPGHNPRQVGEVEVAPPTAGRRALLLHNELQTRLYSRMSAQHGAASVGTEVPTGYGTSIDLVVKTAEFCWFYEIKVAKSIKACIRQAIPQLLEYAYWREDGVVVDRLYIASKFAMTPQAEAYLALLRDRFHLPLFYERIDVN